MISKLQLSGILLNADLIPNIVKILHEIKNIF